MYSFYPVLLQAAQGNYTGFVIKAGLIIISLTAFIVTQSVYNRRRKNILLLEKKMLQENFDTQIMQNKIEVQEATFESLGIELHDNIGQLLSTAKILIGVTERKLEVAPLTLVSANETLNKAITELRNLTKSLNKEWLEEFDLYTNLTAEVKRINAGQELQVHINQSRQILPAGPREQFMFFRILQEGIHNVQKHAKASALLISITYNDAAISATLSDNGKGFDVKGEFTGLGIMNMRKRMSILQGKIDWFSSPAGTTVKMEFPVKT